MTQSAGLRGFPEPGTLDVLFVAYGRGHIQAIVSVAQRMQAQGYTISVFAVTTATGRGRSQRAAAFRLRRSAGSNRRTCAQDLL